MDVKEKLKDKKLNIIAALLMGIETAFLTDFDDCEEGEYIDEDYAMRRWNQAVNAVVNGTWKKGVHCGDCTNVPSACWRCIVEEYITKAEKLIKES
jgi:hypothetical protein